jgi:transcriptional regulator of acetoin/glycerol metabolism
MRYEDLDARSLHGALRAGDPGAIKYVKKALVKNGWRILATADALSVTRQTLWNWLRLPTMRGVSDEQKKATGLAAKNP